MVIMNKRQLLSKAWIRIDKRPPPKSPDKRQFFTCNEETGIFGVSTAGWFWIQREHRHKVDPQYILNKITSGYNATHWLPAIGPEEK